MTRREIGESQSYFAQADSWAVDREKIAESSRRTAWIVASVSAIIALCEALALTALVPLKKVEPYTLLVDRQTGYVQVLKPLQPQLVSGGTALTQSFLVQYVLAREGFDIDSVQSDFRKVALWSTGSARSEYLSRMAATSASSPLSKYPRPTVITAEIKSISALSDRVALIRFDTVRHDAGRAPEPGQPWIAVVHYDFSSKPMSVSDRYINPLGFQVSHYNRSAETLGSPPTQASMNGTSSSKMPGNGSEPGGLSRPDQGPHNLTSTSTIPLRREIGASASAIERYR